MSSPASPSVDAVIVGGGPAGAAAATMLARHGHRVVVLTRGAPVGPRLAESLPPSIVKPLTAVGLRTVLEDTAWWRGRGNTVWWGTADERREAFAGGAVGFQVDRRRFDERLLAAAEHAGATVRRGLVVDRVDLGSPTHRVHLRGDGHRGTLETRVILDCAGRGGVIRLPGERGAPPSAGATAPDAPVTVALAGAWRRDDAWPVPDPSHTLVESYAEGWAWSVPLSADVRHVAVMVDPRTTALAHRGALTRTYRAELRKTGRLRALVEEATPVGDVWATDASVRSPEAVVGPGWLRVGDAASCVDPLSSFGVRKALTSAWLAGVVARTWLEHPERTDLAAGLYDRRERESFGAAQRQAAGFFRDVAREEPHPFWQDRAGAEPERAASTVVADLRRDPDVRAALEGLRRRDEVRLRRTRRATHLQRPAVTDDLVVMEPTLRVEGWSASEGPDGLRFVRDVDLLQLLELAPRHRRVPDLYEAYERAGPDVPLADFLGALATLIAKGALREEGDRTDG